MINNYSWFICQWCNIHIIESYTLVGTKGSFIHTPKRPLNQAVSTSQGNRLWRLLSLIAKLWRITLMVFQQLQPFNRLIKLPFDFNSAGSIVGWRRGHCLDRHHAWRAFDCCPKVDHWSVSHRERRHVYQIRHPTTTVSEHCSWVAAICSCHQAS